MSFTTVRVRGSDKKTVTLPHTGVIEQSSKLKEIHSSYTQQKSSGPVLDVDAFTTDRLRPALRWMTERWYYEAQQGVSGAKFSSWQNKFLDTLPDVYQLVPVAIWLGLETLADAATEAAVKKMKPMNADQVRSYLALPCDLTIEEEKSLDNEIRAIETSLRPSVS